MGTVYLATMPHSYGYRARTRKLFARDFRQHGMPALKTYLTNYKVGDLVDIKANGNKVLEKRITVRVEHVRPSNSRKDFLKRVVANEAIKTEARKNKTKAVGIKRQPVQPRPGQ